MLCLGDCLSEIANATQHGADHVLFTPASMLCFVILLLVKFLVFDVCAVNVDDHALRRHRLAALAFRMAHFLLAFGIVTSSSGMALMIEHEVETAAGGGGNHSWAPHHRVLFLVGTGEGEHGHGGGGGEDSNAPAPAQTLFSGGLGITVLSLVIISATHKRIWHEKDPLKITFAERYGLDYCGSFGFRLDSLCLFGLFV